MKLICKNPFGQALMCLAVILLAGCSPDGGGRSAGTAGGGLEQVGTAEVERASERLLYRTDKLIKRSLSYDQKAVLDGLGENRFNGYFYRFDEKLSDARVGGEPPPETGPSAAGVKYGFEDGPGIFLLGGKPPVVKDGILYADGGSNTLLYNDPSAGPLPVTFDRLASVKIRARHSAGTEMMLFFNAKVKDGRLAESDKTVVNVKVIPDGEFHEYVVKARNIPWKIRGDKNMNSIIISPTDSPEGEVWLDYIEIVTNLQDYAERPAGTAFVEQGDESRSCMYSYRGMDLGYDVSLPDAPVSLVFGAMAVCPGQDTVASVSLDDGSGGVELYSTVLGDSSGWDDVEIPLDGWRGRDVRITFSSKAPSGSVPLFGVALWSSPMLMTKPRKRFNVVIYLEDTFRGDRISASGYSDDTTPVKDFYASKGALFLNSFSQATKTIVSCPSTMTGMYPTATGVWHIGQSLDDNYITLAEVMRSQGFKTYSYVQAFQAGSYAGLDQGYDTLIEGKDKGSTALGVERFSRWLVDNGDENFFAYFHVIDPHGPYAPGLPYRLSYLMNRGETPVRRHDFLDAPYVENPTVEGRRYLYDGEVRQNDELFGDFMDKLKDLGIYEDTLVIFMADHGEFLGEHGMWEHHPPGFREVINVPLLMSYPAGIRPGLVIREPVQNIDIFPTVMDFAGIETRGLMLQGDSLAGVLRGGPADTLRERAVVSEEVTFRRQYSGDRPLGSVIMGDMHYISTFVPKGANVNRFPEGISYFPDDEVMLFDMGADRAETEVIDDDRLRERMGGLLGELQDRNMALHGNMASGMNAGSEANTEVIEQLKSLGYVQ